MARFLAFALAALTLLAAAACGGGDETQPAPETVEGTVPAQTGGGDDDGGGGGDVEGDPEAGAEVFASAGCGSCHTLSDAGTSGSVGPNLDESSASYDQALAQIQNGGGGMPAYSGQLSEEEIVNVAAYVVTARG
ncbi:MAG TPA: cytochrome c [Gaiellaceae bacterium]|nr:cytochrome c [Gaiellaceae bacterium]